MGEGREEKKGKGEREEKVVERGEGGKMVKVRKGRMEGMGREEGMEYVVVGGRWG